MRSLKQQLVCLPNMPTIANYRSNGRRKINGRAPRRPISALKLEYTQFMTVCFAATHSARREVVATVECVRVSHDQMKTLS